MMLLLIKAPNTLSLTLPTDAQGNITATKAQVALHDALDSIAVEWGSPVGSAATNNLFRVLCRHTDLKGVKAIITTYKLPVTILHAQDAYESDTGKVTAVNGMNTPIMQPVVYKQGTKASLLPFMPDVVTYDPKTMKELSRKKATSITLPNCSDMAAWSGL